METIISNNFWFFILAMLWVLPWKGYSLWTAAKLGHKRWFIALVILNTFAILEIFYIFYVAKKTPKDLINTIKSKI